MKAMLSFETALTARTLDALLERDCLKKYAVTYRHLDMDHTGARKSVSIEFDDQGDCERFRGSVHSVDSDAGLIKAKEARPKRRAILGLFAR